MKRILCSLTAFLLLLGIGDARAQQQTTVSIPEVVAEAGTAVSVPINVANFTDVGAITLAIEYDSDALTFQSVENFAGDSGLNASAQNGVVRLSWFSLESLNIGSGKLVDLVFTFEGGSSQLDFLASSEIADAEANPIDVMYDGGAVLAEAVEVSLGSARNVENGATVEIPIVASEPINNFGSVSLVVNYSAAALDVADPLVTDTSEAFEQFVAASPSDGQINIGGYSTAGVALGDTIAVLQFVSQGTSTTISFGGASEITDVNDTPVAVVFASGQVFAAGEEVGMISVPDTAIAPGAMFELPVMAENLTGIGSASLEITFDPSVLTFEQVMGFDAFGGNGITSNPEPGVIRLAGFSTAGVDLGGTLATLEFVYNGGSTEVDFDQTVSQVTNLSDQEINVFFEGGTITELPAEADIYFFDQVTEGEVVMIDSVSMSRGGFVAIHDTTLLDGDALGSVIGVSEYLEAGMHADVAVTLFDVPGLDTTATMLTSDQTLIAMPHVDSNGNETYDFLTEMGGADGPYLDAEGSPVVADAFVQVVQELTIAEAREAAEGSIVSVEGTVTRAMGRNIWMQSNNAGIMLFSFDGDFPVASEVEGGDRISVTGEISIFNDLVEIMPDTIVVLDDNAGIPPAQQVTPGELTEDCEMYQSELVQIDRLRYTLTPDNYEPITFEANSSYSFFDAVEDSITVRIQRESDTEFVGYTLENNAFSFLGVVGQYRDDCQLMPVLEGVDIYQVRAIDREDELGVPEQFALHGNYPNPFNPSTSISFDLPAAADVTITVYDVVGREVRTVQMGQVAPGAGKTVSVNAADLGSGVYLYRVVAVSGDETHSATGRMVLVK